MWVLEIYQSKQGEGIWTGHYSIFVRLLGCPLRCRFCDSAYAQRTHTESGVEIGADLSPEEIAGRVLLLDLPHVVITGGEPMMSSEIVQLTKLLREYDYRITIETAGIFDQPVECDLMSISPKMKNSVPTGSDYEYLHEKKRSEPMIVKSLINRYNYQLKFVVDNPGDLEEIRDYLAGFDDVPSDRVVLMPQAIDVEAMGRKAEWIVPFCEKNGYRYSPRMQIVWYGNKRRT